jgi:hypothetical protein
MSEANAMRSLRMPFPNLPFSNPRHEIFSPALIARAFGALPVMVTR